MVFLISLIHLRPFKVLGHKTVWREPTCGVKKSTSYGNQSSWPFHIGVENRIQMASGEQPVLLLDRGLFFSIYDLGRSWEAARVSNSPAAAGCY